MLNVATEPRCRAQSLDKCQAVDNVPLDLTNAGEFEVRVRSGSGALKKILVGDAFNKASRQRFNSLGVFSFVGLDAEPVTTGILGRTLLASIRPSITVAFVV